MSSPRARFCKPCRTTCDDRAGRRRPGGGDAGATDPRFLYEHRWRAGDLLLWDDAATLHKALPCGPGARKVTRRVTVLPGVRRGHAANLHRGAQRA
jgi:hypothetical protein